jgi:hypothetical protein
MGHVDDSYRRGAPPHLLHEVQPAKQVRLIGLDLFGLERGRSDRAGVDERYAPALSPEHRRGGGARHARAHDHDVKERILSHVPEPTPVRLARTENLLPSSYPSPCRYWQSGESLSGLGPVPRTNAASTGERQVVGRPYTTVGEEIFMCRVQRVNQPGDDFSLRSSPAVGDVVTDAGFLLRPWI